jgi:hypothetical protein
MPGKTPRRAVELAIVLVIGATLIAVVASSWPLWWRLFQPAQPLAAKQGIARALRSRGWAVTPPDSKKHHRVFGPQHETFPFPDTDRSDPHRDGVEELPDSMAGSFARPRSIVQLLDRGDPDGEPVVSVGPDETLIIVRELTPWLLLAVKRDERVHFGWTTRDQVEILP